MASSQVTLSQQDIAALNTKLTEAIQGDGLLDAAAAAATVQGVVLTPANLAQFLSPLDSYQDALAAWAMAYDQVYTSQVQDTSPRWVRLFEEHPKTVCNASLDELCNAFVGEYLIVVTGAEEGVPIFSCYDRMDKNKGTDFYSGMNESGIRQGVSALCPDGKPDTVEVPTTRDIERNTATAQLVHARSQIVALQTSADYLNSILDKMTTERAGLEGAISRWDYTKLAELEKNLTEANKSAYQAVEKDIAKAMVDHDQTGRNEAEWAEHFVLLYGLEEDVGKGLYQAFHNADYAAFKTQLEALKNKNTKTKDDDFNLDKQVILASKQAYDDALSKQKALSREVQDFLALKKSLPSWTSDRYAPKVETPLTDTAAAGAVAALNRDIDEYTQKLQSKQDEIKKLQE